VTLGTVAERLSCDNNDTNIDLSEFVRLSVSISWSVMITGLSTISLLLGTAIAYMATRYPKRRAVMETVGGALLIGGLSLIGYALESVLGSP
jgi:hypothetical protein